MGVDLRRARTRVSKIGLDQSKIHPVLEQVRRVGVAQRMNARLLADTRLDTSSAEGSLQARAVNRARIVLEAVLQTLARYRREEPYW